MDQILLIESQQMYADEIWKFRSYTTIQYLFILHPSTSMIFSKIPPFAIITFSLAAFSGILKWIRFY